MTKAELWRFYCEKNPAFLGLEITTVTLRVRGLRKLHEQSYDAGFEAGKAVAAAFDNLRSHAKDGASMFEEFFGKEGK